MSKVIKADIYPEFGTYPGGGESPIIPFGSEKNAEREVIHGRWEDARRDRRLGGGERHRHPVVHRGYLVHPGRLHRRRGQVPRRRRAPSPPRAPATPPSGPSSPSRSSSSTSPRRTAPASPTPSSTSSPSVTSPPVAASTPGLAESGDLEELKIKELKHCRLSMFAWLGCIIRASPPRRAPSPTGRRTSRTPSTPTSSPTRPLRLRLLLSGVRDSRSLSLVSLSSV